MFKYEFHGFRVSDETNILNQSILKNGFFKFLFTAEVESKFVILIHLKLKLKLKNFFEVRAVTGAFHLPRVEAGAGAGATG